MCPIPARTSEESNNVAVRDREDEHEEQHESDRVRRLLQALVHPDAAHLLDEEEKHPPAVERRYGQNVQRREVHREYADEAEEIGNAKLARFVRKKENPDRPGNLRSHLAPGNEPRRGVPEGAAREREHVPGRSRAFDRRAPPGDADNAGAHQCDPKRAFALRGIFPRTHPDYNRFTAPEKFQMHDLAAMRADELLHFFHPGDGVGMVHRLFRPNRADYVPEPDACIPSGRMRIHGNDYDPGIGGMVAILDHRRKADGVACREKHPGEELDDGNARGDDGDALPHRARAEARGVLGPLAALAVDLHVPADGKKVQRVARTVLYETRDTRREAEGEFLDPHPEFPRHEKVPPLMHEHERTEEKNEEEYRDDHTR